MYIAAQSQRLAGVDYNSGDRIPASEIAKLKTRVLNVLVHAGRIRYESEPDPERPQYVGGGWWVFANGMKLRGKKDSPPTLNGSKV